MADAILQFSDCRGDVHPTPEEAVVADLIARTGLNPVLARGIVERKAEIEAAFRNLDTLRAAHGETVAAQEIERRARKSRSAIATPGSALRPATTQE